MAVWARLLTEPVVSWLAEQAPTAGTLLTLGSATVGVAPTELALNALVGTLVQAANVTTATGTVGYDVGISLNPASAVVAVAAFTSSIGAGADIGFGFASVVAQATTINYDMADIVAITGTSTNLVGAESFIVAGTRLAQAVGLVTGVGVALAVDSGVTALYGAGSVTGAGAAVAVGVGITYTVPLTSVTSVGNSLITDNGYGLAASSAVVKLPAYPMTIGAGAVTVVQSSSAVVQPAELTLQVLGGLAPIAGSATLSGSALSYSSSVTFGAAPVTATGLATNVVAATDTLVPLGLGTVSATGVSVGVLTAYDVQTSISSVQTQASRLTYDAGYGISPYSGTVIGRGKSYAATGAGFSVNEHIQFNAALITELTAEFTSILTE